jgi:biopolymer transport protein ExbD
MITRPLDLESRLSPPPRDFNFVAWVNVAVIILFCSLLGSRFVLAPGLLIGGGNFGLPATGGPQLVQTASVVVNYRRDNDILFEGARVNLGELRQRLEVYAKRHPGEILILAADRQVSTQALFELYAMAQAAGFSSVLIAGQSAAETPALK